MPRIRVMLDACLPHWLRHRLYPHDVETAHHAGLDQLADAPLLDAIEGRFDILVTMDRNLSFQQRLAGRRLAVLVVRVRDQSPDSFESIVPALSKAIAEIAPGQLRTVGIDAE